MKHLFFFRPIMLAVMLFSTLMLFAAEEIYDVNFALTSNGASAEATSGNAGAAIDGNTGTRWESASSDPQTWTLDLGQERVFNTLEIVWEGAYGKTFTVSTSSDKATWTPVWTVEGQSLAGFPYTQTQKIDKTTARYIQFHGTERGTGYGYSFWEFRVLLPGESVLTTMQLNPAAPTAKIGSNHTLTLIGKDQNGVVMSDFGTPEYTVTPTEAGRVEGNNFIPAQLGKATITAQVGTVTASCEVIAYDGDNIALSTQQNNKVIEQSGPNDNSDLDAYKAVDGDEGNQWQGSLTNGTTDDEVARTYDSWFIVDFGAYYDVNLVTIKFEGACAQDYHVDFSADKSTWNVAYNHIGNAGIYAHTKYLYGSDLQNATKVRYVRFWSTKAATQYGMKIYEMKVYGTEWQNTGDTNPPTMGTAEVVSTTYNSAYLRVSATDAEGDIWGYRVTSTAPIWQKFCEPDANGQIILTGLTAGDYTVTIKAVDASNNESLNETTVSFNIPVQEIAEVNFALSSNGSTATATTQENAVSGPQSAIDGNSETVWSSLFEDPQTWILDLGQLRVFNTIQIDWNPLAYAKAYTISTSKDNVQWEQVVEVSNQTSLAEVTQTHSIDKTTARYVKFHGTERASVYGYSFREFRVYLSGASILTTLQATPAEDVVKVGNSTAITIIGKDQHGIVMNEVGIVEYTITPADAGRVENNVYYPTKAGVASIVATVSDVKAPAFTITAYDGVDKPTSAPTPPTHPAERVKSIYSDVYGNTFNALAGWPDAPTYEELTLGEDHVRYYTQFTGQLGWLVQQTPINAVLMEKLHLDIWTNVDATIDVIFPVGNGAPDISKTVTLIGQQWNSIDLTLATDYAGLDLSSINQLKFANPKGASIFAIDNVYFYRESDISNTDQTAPTNFTCEINAQSYVTIDINCQAEDESGFVTFTVMLGTEYKGSKSVLSGEIATITIQNLFPGEDYEFEVIAEDLYGNSTSKTITHATDVLVIGEDTDPSTLPQGIPCNVTFNREMVVADGIWNTIALPFSMTATQISNTFGVGTRVAKLQTTSTVASQNEINLMFAYVNEIEAGVPYIILPKSNGQGIVIENVNISITEKPIVVPGQVTMYPVLKTISYNYSNGDPIKFFLSPDGNLHYNESTNSIKALRAYFTFDNVTSVAAAANVRARIVLNENEATGFDQIVAPEGKTIKAIVNGQLVIIRGGEMYNVQGQKL